MSVTIARAAGAVLILSALGTFADDGDADGGIVLKPGSYQGRVVVLNRQTRVPETDLRAAAALFATCTECNVAVAADAAGAAITLTVIDDPKDPSVLLAPEDHWGRLNVARLVDDLPSEKAKKKFLVPRTRKMLLKTLSHLCGGASSSFKGNIMNAATIRELDVIPEQIPIDMYDKYADYLRRLGVTKKEVATYYEACQAGWAPAPTNEIQKTYWDEVHEIPTKPIKIKYQKPAGK